MNDQLITPCSGNSLPMVSNVSGSSSTGNMMPDSMIEGRKTMIETMDVLA